MRIPTNTQTMQTTVPQEIPVVKERSIGDTSSLAEVPQIQPDPIHNELRSARMQSELALSGQLQRSSLQAQIDVLGKGSSGPQVLELQKELNKVRAEQGKPPIAADGIFGPKSEAAVKEFQQEQGLKVDGQAGPITKAALALENLKAKSQGNPATLENLLKEFKDLLNERNKETQRTGVEQFLKKVLDGKILDGAKEGAKAIPQFDTESLSDEIETFLDEADDSVPDPAELSDVQDFLTDPDHTDDLED